MNVEITIPAWEKTYEFELNEELPLRLLAEDIAEVICQRERCALQGNAAELLLFHVNTKRLLRMDQTLIQADVAVGDRLLLA